MLEAEQNWEGTRCVGSGGLWEVRRNELVLFHRLGGSPLPIDWCPLGGAERCFLKHWKPAGTPKAEMVELDETQCCVVCDGECAGVALKCAGAHCVLDGLHLSLRTLTRDSRRCLDSDEEFLDGIGSIFQCKFGIEKSPPMVSFSRELRLLWLRRPWAVPGRGEVWMTARRTGMGEVISGCRSQVV